MPASLTRNSSVSAGSDASAVFPEIKSFATLAAVTVPSDGAPKSNTSPKIITKSITSPVVYLYMPYYVTP